jgi:hypothetical protein
VVEERIQQHPSPREQRLLQLHGEVCGVEEAAQILKYPSAHALRRALSRSKAPIQLVKLPHRRGLFASTRAIARYLDEHLGIADTQFIANRRATK